MKFVVPKTEAVICGTGKPYLPGTLCLMLQMKAEIWVALPTDKTSRQRLISCQPGLPDGRVVPKGTRTHHYVLVSEGDILPQSKMKAG